MDKAEREKLRKEYKTMCSHVAQRLMAALDHIDALEQKRDGWKLVPVEPTPAMIDASYLVMIGCSDEIYKAMVAVAPELQEVQG